MTPHPSARLVRLLAPAMLVLALGGCAVGGAGSSGGPSTGGSASSGGSSSSASSPGASGSGSCAEVAVVVDFGTLDAPSIRTCGPAGVALDTLKGAKVSTEGSGDYGDAVVCRVDGHPSPAQESCVKLPSDAYWALWVKSSADAEWAYAQQGVASLKLTAGESVGLVYTHGTDSTPPQG